MKKIGIIGPNKSMCSDELYAFGVQLGRQIATTGRSFVCGGLGGFMEAVAAMK
jgi:predicted Rossmann-fold nucleotide-binding protein